MTATATTTDPTPRLADFTATGASTGQLSTAVEARHFSFVVAEPESLGGTDEGANPIEYLLGSLNGCVTVVIETVATELGITVEGVRTDATGTIDLRGFAGTADVSPHFQQVTLTVTLATAAAEDELAELRARVLRRCPVFNLIRDAGVDIRETWDVRRPS
ncbi:OsmC family protein [Georgenia sp. H159]|uniref:OsmC family protein n=1 Tax=Georgenia sp. H159 TaxID=3076115 RepID=UPI002D77F07B|nr:OsmC family protein [Georgenia sp. H159]